MTTRRASRLPLALWAFLGLLLALVPAGIVQVLLEREARQERTEQLGEQAMRLVRLLAREQTANIEAARQLLSAIAAHDSIRANRPGDECDAFLARIVAANPRYVTANLFSPAGDNICSAQPEKIRRAQVGDRPYLRAVLRENSFQIGEYAVGRGTGEPSLHMAMPLHDAAGAPVGIVVVGLSIRWLSENLATVQLPPGGVSTIADRGGIVLARSLDPGSYVGQPLAPSSRHLPMAPQAGTADVTGRDGVRRVLGYVPLSEGPKGALFIAVGLEAEQAMASAAAADRRATLMIVGSLLLTFLLAIIGFHAAIERPVRRLLAAAQHWAGQNWAARVGYVGGGREFDRLAAAFDGMAATVEARTADRQSAVARMEALLRVAPQIVLTADRDGRVEWVNEFWRQTTGLSEEESRGDGWLAGLHPEDRGSAWTAWREATTGAGQAGSFSREVRVRRAADGGWHWFLLRSGPVGDGTRDGAVWAIVGVDFHEHREAQAAIAASTAQLQATYRTAPAGLCLMDRELRFIALNERLAAIDGKPVAAHLGRRFAEMAPHVAPELEAALRRVLETGQPVEEFELRVRLNNEDRFWLCSSYPLRGALGEVTGVSAALVDITARKRVEASERMLSREVDHRAQNALSVVRGLVRLSAADAVDDVPALVEVLEGRIGAMSRAHNVLSREKWVGADLLEIARQELAAHAGQTVTEGPSLRLTPEAAQPLTLVLHELTTNAAKYGALSRPEGRVTLRWAREAGGVVLQWIERGGPEVAGVPGRTGFGSMLIDANMRGQLAGDIERDWNAAGLRCRMTIGPEAVAGGAPDLSAGAGPLTGRRVLVAEDDPVSALTLAAALREGGCEVEGPAATVEEAMMLLERAGKLDAAILTGTLAGRSVQPVAQLLQRRAVAVLHLSPLGVPAEGGPDTDVMPRPVTATALREALIAALNRGAAA